MYDRTYTVDKENYEIPISEAFFPPPWNINEYPEKTKGWIEFQKAIRKDSDFYSSIFDK